MLNRKMLNWKNCICDFANICFDNDSKLSGELLVQQRRNSNANSTALQSHFIGDSSLNSSRISKLPHLALVFVEIMQNDRASTRCFQLW